MAQFIDLDESSDEQAPTVRTFKVTVMGDGSVGKSSICSRFTKDFFATSYKQTIGVDFFSQTVCLDDGSKVTFNLYDIGGQSIGSKMLSAYISGTHAFIFVYDLTNAESLENVVEWYAMVKKAVKSMKDVVVYLVGNKSDLATLRVVRSSRSNEISAAINASAHLLLSALTGDRIGLLFISLAGRLCGVDVTTMILDGKTGPAVEVNRDTEETVGGINRDRFLGDADTAVGANAIARAKELENGMAKKIKELEEQSTGISRQTLVGVEKAKRSGRCTVM
ncbi:GTPase/ Rab28/ RabF subfamily protein [Giardia duodenalis assemblage B]|uniref:GTPase/ Rab28/ RabF subfamily protein n=1 Tax=Giardia duodenalis assemblage B TaxID=1394984 RepID=A0A132P0F1_GIAIN|nr:GTPase/ Rab28/ RabF subfamily protein [Giardia intestinalis assemblage B]